MKQFDNPNNISKAIALLRVHNLDADADVSLYDVTRIDGSIAHYISIESILADDQLQNLFAAAVSADEQTYIASIATNRQAIKDAYDTMINRLDQIQAASNPTNAQIVAAIKDEALYIERIMKFIKTTLF